MARGKIGIPLDSRGIYSPSPVGIGFQNPSRPRQKMIYDPAEIDAATPAITVLDPMKWRIIPTVSVPTISLFLVSCQKPASINDLRGTWVAKNASQQKWVKGTNSCQMVFRSDGTFTASVPDYLMTTFDKASGKVMSGKGQWNLESPRALAPREIKLSFSEVDGERINWSSNGLQAERGKQGIELFLYVGEEGGERFSFEQAPIQPPSARLKPEASPSR